MSVKTAYNKRASYYDNDLDTNFLFDMEKKQVLDLLDIKKTDEILDLGCGSGKYIPLLLRKTQKITCYDISDKMVKLVLSKFPKLKCSEGDMTKKLPSKNASFDKILCAQAIKHIKDITKTFKEIYRILKPKGNFVFTTIHPESNWSGYKTKTSNTIEIDEPCFVTKQPLSTLFTAIENVGFKIVGIEQCEVGENVRKLLTTSSYKTIKGRPLVLIIKTRK